MSANQKIIALLIALGMILFTWWFLNNFKIEEAEITLPPKGEARYNKLFAAEHYLKALGVTADSFTLPEILLDIPDHHAVMVIDTNRFSLTKQTTQKLLNWTRAGGHLILRPGYRVDFDEDQVIEDELLKSLNISARVIHEPLSDQLLELPFRESNGQRSIFVESYSYFYLIGHQPTDKIAEDANGVHMIQRHLGEGMVTVLSDMRFFENAQIDIDNHALALWHLVHSSNANTVKLVYSEKSNSLIALIWRKQKPFLVSSLMLLFFWLFYSSQRFGPIKQPQVDKKRSILEHVNASGMHYWKNGGSKKLITRRRASFHDKMNSKQSAWHSFSMEEKVTHLVAITNWSEAEIRSTLQTGTASKPNEFTQLMQQIQLLEKQI